MKKFFTKKCENAFSPVPNWVQRLATITMGAKLTYGRLLQCANDDGVAWPTQRYLASELGCSLRSIVKYVGELKRNNLIEVSKVFFGDYPRTTYRFIIPEDLSDVLLAQNNLNLVTSPIAHQSSEASELQHISSAPASCQGLHDKGADQCKPCAEASKNCLGGTQTLRMDYATSALPYNDNKNKRLKQSNKTTPHIPPQTTATSLATKTKQNVSGEKVSSFSSTLPDSPRNHSIPTSLMDARGQTPSRPASPFFEDLSSSFEAVWELFPLKQGKAPAQTRWNQLFKHKQLPELSVIISSIKEHIAKDSRWKRGMIPNLERWLREHRWTDQPFADPAGDSQRNKTSQKQELEIKAAMQLKHIRDAIKGYPVPIDDPVTKEVIDSHGGISSLSRMPERNLPFVLSTFVKEYTALSISKTMEVMHV
ncbi:helix-turn-helix domain-containing protein [Halodesulfovibrio marinisediminis]|uniref:Helix-turn-helix domain-containing protein n=1 Tax=Halodesulfovibrio marinisediminis DSM 17456 TaxID=1121457 RepID=A0A1N6FFL2_9BACT|nr:helix-turn-helix domain-containing protein [Halodesulfovibrio marinisediminis]SIN94083.1 Helix-turn-helix domain-containing protein [Halodesulfovibrio marinisediminis DSM 17456]